MRAPVRIALDACLAAAALMVSVARDASLFSIFKAGFWRVNAIPHYRPVYLRSGRRNRARR
jgi:hypothetical protein